MNNNNGTSYLTKSTGSKPAGTPNFTLPGYSTSYTYDAIGNLTTRTNEGQPTTYTYSPSQPHAATSLSGNSTASYTYDSNGNMTNRTEAGITYTQQFDVQNRLTQVTVNNASTTKFYYDASGQRTLTEEPSGDLIYTPFPAYEEEIPGAAPESLPIQRVTFGLGQPIAIHVSGDSVTSNNGTFYLHTDHLGSTSYLTKSTGSKVSGSDARYQPFGPYRTTPTQTITDTGYTGQHHNPSLGLIYYNARYYAPSLARFISPDTIVPDPAGPQTFNRYSYTRNNPTGRVDPTGHVDCTRLGDSADMEMCDVVKDSIVETPRPTIPNLPLVNVDDLDPNDPYQAAIIAAIQEAALLVGQALANVLNQMNPNWHLTAVEAFLLIYGGTVEFIWKGTTTGNYAAWTKGANEIWIYDTKDTVGRVTNKVHWIIHELGHAFSTAVGGTTEDTQAFLDSNPGVGRLADGTSPGYFGNKDANGRLLWQQSDRLSASEQFADMFIGWVYGQWQTNSDGSLADEGIAMSNFMNGNMPYWLNLKVQQ